MQWMGPGQRPRCGECPLGGRSLGRTATSTCTHDIKKIREHARMRRTHATGTMRAKSLGAAAGQFAEPRPAQTYHEAAATATPQSRGGGTTPLLTPYNAPTKLPHTQTESVISAHHYKHTLGAAREPEIPAEIPALIRCHVVAAHQPRQAHCVPISGNGGCCSSPRHQVCGVHHG
jgi:hypothetical protein